MKARGEPPISAPTPLLPSPSPSFPPDAGVTFRGQRWAPRHTPAGFKLLAGRFAFDSVFVALRSLDGHLARILALEYPRSFFMTLLNNNNIEPNWGKGGSTVMVGLTGRQALGDLIGGGIDMQRA